MKAKHLMSVPAITVNADTTLKEIVRILDSHQISSVPVVDHVGKVIGLISWNELFPREKIIRPPDIRIPMLFREIIDLKHMVDSYKQAIHLTAKDMMSHSPVCVDADEHIGQVVWTMVQDDLHMVPIVSGDILVGVFTRRDFIRLLAQEL